jgi:predicted Zn-dependent protease
MKEHLIVRATRLVLSAVAVVLIAWFVLGARQAHEIDAATAIVTAGPTAKHQQLRAAGTELNAAAFLDPDREVNVLRGRLAIVEGQIGKAQRILERTTSSEPQNLEAWVWLVGASLRNHREAKIGFAHLRALDPLDIH